MSTARCSQFLPPWRGTCRTQHQRSLDHRALRGPTTRKIDRELKDLREKRANDGPIDDFTLEDLQERIHGLNLAYYWMKRQHPRVCNDHMRNLINANSLPHEPKLKLQDGVSS